MLDNKIENLKADLHLKDQQLTDKADEVRVKNLEIKKLSEQLKKVCHRNPTLFRT